MEQQAVARAFGCNGEMPVGRQRGNAPAGRTTRTPGNLKATFFIGRHIVESQAMGSTGDTVAPQSPTASYLVGDD